MYEIGSEFWAFDSGHKWQAVFPQNSKLLLSGRTALDFIIKDIIHEYRYKTVMMPSYCCDSMIRPFLDNGFKISFYDILFKNGKFYQQIPEQCACDVVLIMQYFGFVNTNVGTQIKKLKKLGKIIIEDATHSWFSNLPYSKASDYVFNSFRKWTGIAGGAIAIKHTGRFQIKYPELVHDKYIDLRTKAAEEKKSFITTGLGNKYEFLEKFTCAEELLDIDYQGYTAPDYLQKKVRQLDNEFIVTRRYSNAHIIINELQGLVDHIDIPSLNDGDVPLFVPIFVQNQAIRNRLRKWLIDRKIYIPVHWPKTNYHTAIETDLYETEMSVICDQRYGSEEMNHITRKIKEFFQQ